jgi:hypothetical protein
MICSPGVTPSRKPREITLDQFRRTLIIFESWQLKLEIRDRSWEIWVCDETATA